MPYLFGTALCLFGQFEICLRFNIGIINITIVILSFDSSIKRPHIKVFGKRQFFIFTRKINDNCNAVTFFDKL